MADVNRAERRGDVQHPTKKTVVNKMVLIGDVSVGKTSIVNRFIKDEFSDTSDSTVGAVFLTRAIETEDCLLKFDIWDTAGQERYRALASIYYREARSALDSFERAKEWNKELLKSAEPDIIIGFVGNKIDLKSERQVSTREAQKYADENQLFHYEVSAKTGENITDMFIDIANKMPKQRKQTDENFTKLTRAPEESQSKKCC